MSQYCALLSIIYMISFVILFDKVHCRKRLHRLLCAMNLLSEQEVDQLRMIMAACQDG
jgi:hypothetical protein